MITYALATVGALTAWFYFAPEPKPKAGIYKQRSVRYTIKYFFFRLILWLRQRKNKQLKSTSGQNAGYGMRSRVSPEEMDKAQDLPSVHKHPKAVDAVYFNAGNRDGYFLVTATARRQNNIVQTLLYLRTPELGILQGTFMSQGTNLEGTDPGGFAAGGLKMTPQKAMEEWRLVFSGKMVITKTGEEVDVTFDLLWTAFTPYFDFDTEMNPITMADAICRETWSRSYFEELQRYHQTHYEQFGDIRGTVKIGGYDDINLNVSGVRDHSYGNIRDWKDLHRYAIQYCTLEDKTAVCLGVISMPRSLSKLLMGYVFHPDGRLDTVTWSSLELFEHGEDGIPPKEFSAKFSAGGKMYNMKCTVVDMARFFIGEGKDARIFERFCDYEVNGQKGWGISEWDYRNSKRFFEDGESI
ncbi:uncharacterized protein LOC133185967 [Saccostrea echinata]|uniref:uncharacterized protein LOC133185967 n=1 Tax=Saccostrea echinata TaxID=191078 RepID=UPI002A83D550|nr:uncharacterized protein LOC133185967 [Saccostrea echinata]